MLLVVIIIICNDLWVFSIDPLYFGYHSVEQETPVFCIFTFQESCRTQIDLGFFWALIYYHENLVEHKKSTREAMEVKQDLVAWAQAQVMPPRLV
jgi:hypothetical protein